MKCPSCGREVVIATDLCPWCGYRYEFDGSIERSTPPAGEESDPAVEHERRRWRLHRARGTKRAGAPGRDWTEAGVFRDGGGSPAREKGRPSARGGAGRPASAAAEGGWCGALIRVILPLLAALCLFRAFRELAFALPLLEYYGYYDPAFGAAYASAARGIACVLSSVLAIAARSRLAAGSRMGVALACAAALLPAAAGVGAAVYTTLSTRHAESLLGPELELVAAIVFSAVNAAYFRRHPEHFN